MFLYIYLVVIPAVLGSDQYPDLPDSNLRTDEFPTYNELNNPRSLVNSLILFLVSMYLFSIFFASVLAIPPLQDANLGTTEYPILVVIPDIHGDFEAAKRSLYLGYKAVAPANTPILSFEELSARLDRAVLLGEPGDSIPNSTPGVALVQLGDVIDRGPLSGECLELITAVPKIFGWRTVSLYGNHDMIAMTETWLEMVNPEEILNFGSLEARTEAFQYGGNHFQRYIDSYLGIARWVHHGSINKHRNPNTLFVHAGVSMDWFTNWVVKHVFRASLGAFKRMTSDAAVNQFNSDLRKLLIDPKKSKYIVNEDQSFLWHRYDDSDKSCQSVVDALKLFGVARIVVGHTPQSNRRINSLCDNRLIMADVGMSGWMGLGPSKPVAMILRADEKGDLDSTAVYYEEEPVANIGPPKRVKVSLFERMYSWFV